MTRYNIAALIPARGGSKGVPRKNIKKIAGHPLLAYSIAACEKSKYIDKIFVSTDDEEIARISKEYGAIVPFIRPSEYATDSATDYDVLKHFFQNIDVDDLAYIRPTTPLRDPAHLDEAVERYFEKRGALTAVRSAHEMPESPYKLFKIEGEYFQSFFEDFKGIKNYTNLPRQRFPKAYQPNGYVDIVKRGVVESGASFGEKIFPYITNLVTEVDLPYQFEMLETEIETRGHEILDYLNESHRDGI